ncbi:hypothetical protein GCM10020331_064640 [Ectobacillus funiculus]
MKDRWRKFNKNEQVAEVYLGRRGKSLLKVASLQSGYDESMVLENIDMEVLPGSVVAVLGRNGVGKSTLMKKYHRIAPASCRFYYLGEQSY